MDTTVSHSPESVAHIRRTGAGDKGPHAVHTQSNRTSYDQIMMCLVPLLQSHQSPDVCGGARGQNDSKWPRTGPAPSPAAGGPGRRRPAARPPRRPPQPRALRGAAPPPSQGSERTPTFGVHSGQTVLQLVQVAFAQNIHALLSRSSPFFCSCTRPPP
jgi:hypothetical protein